MYLSNVFSVLSAVVWTHQHTSVVLSDQLFSELPVRSTLFPNCRCAQVNLYLGTYCCGGHPTSTLRAGI